MPRLKVANTASLQKKANSLPLSSFTSDFGTGTDATYVLNPCEVSVQPHAESVSSPLN